MRSRDLEKVPERRTKEHFRDVSVKSFLGGGGYKLVEIIDKSKEKEVVGGSTID